MKTKEGMMCYQETARKIIFTSSISTRGRKKLMEKGLEEFYGKFEIPSEKLNLEEKRCPNGGLVDRLPNWVASH